jgi:sugar (pentulose or hexulose) kinase
VLGRPLEVPRCGDTSALGAAYWARIGEQGIQHLADAEAWPPVEAVYQPDPDLGSRYQELDQLSRELDRAAGPFSEQLADLRDQAD